MESKQATHIEGAISRSGDARSEWFERLWADSHARIYNLAARIVGNRDDAADITQEVFLRAFTHPPDEKGLRDPQPWLYRVTVNACYDHLRRRAVRPTAPLEAVGEIASARDGFAVAEMTRAVEAALGSLTPRYRTALVLKDLHGLDTDEIAGAMDITRATARVLLHRSRAAFRKAFREDAPAGAAIPVAGLAAYLPTLSVPQALQVPPSLAGLAPAAAAALPVIAPTASVSAAGLLAKIGGAVGLKVATVIAAAAVVTGGAVAAHEIEPIARDPRYNAQTATAPGQSPDGGGTGWDRGWDEVKGGPLEGGRGEAQESPGRRAEAGVGAIGGQGTQNPGASGSGPGGSGSGSVAAAGGSGGDGSAGSDISSGAGADGTGASGDSTEGGRSTDHAGDAGSAGATRHGGTSAGATGGGASDTGGGSGQRGGDGGT